jgi:hypothetical protein
MRQRALWLLPLLVSAVGAAATLQLSPEQTQAIAPDPSKALTRLEDIEAAFRGFDFRALAAAAAPPSTRVSGLLLDAARNAAPGRGAAYGVRVAEGNIDAVLLAASGPGAAALARAAAAAGARIRSTLGATVFVTVPLDRVAALEGLPQLVSAWPDWLYRSAQLPPAGGPDAGGIAVTHADRLHALRITGLGVNVGIIDMGFAGYTELQAQGVVPPPVAQRSFGHAVDPGDEERHGTACAEIVHAMAPGAQLWLARFDGSEAAAIDALGWLAEHHVDIISAAWDKPVAPKRGDTRLDKEVDRQSRDNGILWVAAGGNEGEKHWLGKSNVAAGSRLIRIDGSPVRNHDLLALEVQRKGAWQVSVSWDDWPEDLPAGGERQDIDLYLLAVDRRNGRTTAIASSRLLQQGGEPPVETIVDRDGVVPPGTTLYLALSARHVTRLFNVHVNVSGPVKLSPNVADGSLGVPATAREALAVAAYDVRRQQIAAYSSRGPTDDGRTKPEVSGPSNVTTAAYHDESPGGLFDGTSAAVPHVSGFAALLAQARHVKGAALKDAVLHAVQPLGSPVPNPIAGFGLIDGERALPLSSARKSTPDDSAGDADVHGTQNEPQPEHPQPPQ